jgi:hypothetical protein
LPLALGSFAHLCVTTYLYIYIYITSTDAPLEGNNYTPLHLACLRGRADIAALLLERGADVQLSASDGWTTAHLAAVGGAREVLEAVGAAGAWLGRYAWLGHCFFFFFFFC